MERTNHAEAHGLLALMLSHDARRTARRTDAGDLVMLEDLDRSVWDRARIREGIAVTDAVLARGEVGVYGLPAATSAVHTRARTAAETDWARIVELYDMLQRAAPSPVVELNRAVAMVQGPAEGLALVDALAARGELRAYVHLHATRADLLRRLGNSVEVGEAYTRALALSTQESERRIVERQRAATGDI